MMPNKNTIIEQWDDAFAVTPDDIKPDQKKTVPPVVPNPDDTRKKKTVPPDPVPIKNPVNRVGQLTRSTRAKLDWIDPNLIKDLETAVKRAKIGDVQITYARTGHDEGSRHEYGYAVDLSMLNGKGYNGNKREFKILGDILVAELTKLGYTYGEGNNKKSWIWQVADHYNHVHVSRKPPEGAKKLKPTTTDDIKLFEIHQKIQRARWDLYNILTKHPESYFSNFKSVWVPFKGGRALGSDNEEAAAKWLRTSIDNEYGTKFKEWEKTAHPYDKSNIRNLRLIVDWAVQMILNHRSGKYNVTFWNFDEKTNKWKQVNRTYRWDYL